MGQSELDWKWKDRLIWELKVVDYTLEKLNNTSKTEFKVTLMVTTRLIKLCWS